VFHVDWDVTYIFIFIGYMLAAYLHVTILFQGCCNSLIVLVIQLFDTSPTLLIIPFKIQCGCFGFPYFHWSYYRMAKEVDPYLQQYNDCS